MGIEGICPKRNLSKRNLENKIYPYLLSNISLENPRQVYSTDIIYIGLRSGWVYLVAAMEWYSKRVVSWELDQTLNVDFVVEAVKNSITIGKPEIFNSDYAEFGIIVIKEVKLQAMHI